MGKIKKILCNLPQTPGVYFLKDQYGRIIYIGKAVNLKSRVSSYFRNNPKEEKTVQIQASTSDIEIIQVFSEFEALLLEAKLINTHKPKYNVIWRDDKSYIYIKLTQTDFPSFYLARKQNTTDRLFGPFQSKRTARQILYFLREIFPYCTQKTPYKKICFNRHIGLCFPCPYEIINVKNEQRMVLTQNYKDNVRNIKRILSGNIKKVRHDLTVKMKTHAKNKEFENAALLRDRINQLEVLTLDYHNIDRYLENPAKKGEIWENERKSLLENLDRYIKLEKQFEIIECYDISNISGKFAAGSLVTFRRSGPDKSRYRHFRIKTVNQPDDYAMLNEVISRRLKHKEWQLPDLFMVDGGKQQLNILLKTLSNYRVNVPAIALAKRFEEIVVKNKDAFTSIVLPAHSPALKLVTRIRDEAHRFAHRYHQKLRAQYLIDLLQ